MHRDQHYLPTTLISLVFQSNSVDSIYYKEKFFMKSTQLFITTSIALVIFTLATVAIGQSTTNITVTPSYPGVANISGIMLDSSPGFQFGSFQSNGTVGKTEMYFTPAQLFNRTITISEIDSMSYWTKTGSTHAVDPRDWYLVIYTDPYDGDVSSATWYGDRIGTEPYFSANVNDPLNTWNQWTTDLGDNQLRFFESTQGAFGSYTDPHWSTFKTGNALSGLPYAGHTILFFSFQTASSWFSGFTGQLDGFRIELTDGSVATVNFEPFLVATSRDACKKNGWMTLKRSDGTSFLNQGDCVSFVNMGN
jgi:hypothetical protein